MRPILARWKWVALGCLGTGWACTLLNPLDAYGPGQGRPLDASPGGDGGAVAACTLARWPDKPLGDGPTIGDLVFAAETIGVGQAASDAAAAGPVGYDLDGVCTCPGPPSCAGPSGEKQVCDLANGIDNGGSDLFRTLIQVSGEKLDIDESIRAGFAGLVLRLREYDGQPDDASVELDVLLSGGTAGIETGNPKPVARDGNDVWTIDPSSLFDKNVPPYRPFFADTKAYVANGTLVASLDFPLHITDFTVSLHGSVLTASIVKTASGYRLDGGRLVGRWSTAGMLTSLDALHDPFGDTPDAGLCGTDKTYQTLKQRICASVDIASDPNRDSTQAPCDALAMTITFAAGPAQLGAVFEPPLRPHRCGTTWSDDCTR